MALLLDELRSADGAAEAARAGPGAWPRRCIRCAAA